MGQSLECNNGRQCALAARAAPTIGQQVRPWDYSRLHLGSASEPWRLPPSPKGWLCRCQRTLTARVTLEDNARPPLLVPPHPGRGCSTRGWSLPPTRPAGWLFFIGAGEAVCRVRQWPPTCFGTEKDGWAAGTHKRMGAPLSARLGRPAEKKLYGCAECKQNARSGGFCHRLLYPAKEPVEVKHEHELLLTQARHGAHEVRTTP